MIDIRQFVDAGELEDIIVQAASDTSIPYSTLVEKVEDLEITEEMFPDLRQTETQSTGLQNSMAILESLYQSYQNTNSIQQINDRKRICQNLT